VLAYSAAPVYPYAYSAYPAYAYQSAYTYGPSYYANDDGKYWPGKYEKAYYYHQPAYKTLGYPVGGYHY